jgi:hypothetical protein
MGGRRLDLRFDEIADMIRGVGFEDVEVIPFYQPIGIWSADTLTVHAGAKQLVAMLDGLDSLSLAVFTRCLDWTRNELTVLLAQVRKEFLIEWSDYYWPG